MSYQQGTFQVDTGEEKFLIFMTEKEIQKRRCLSAVTTVVVVCFILAVSLPTALVLPRWFDPVSVQLAAGGSLYFRLPLPLWLSDSLVFNLDGDSLGCAGPPLDFGDVPPTFTESEICCTDQVNLTLTRDTWWSFGFGPVQNGATGLALNLQFSQPSTGVALLARQPDGRRPWLNLDRTTVAWQPTDLEQYRDLELWPANRSSLWLLLWNADQAAMDVTGQLDWLQPANNESMCQNATNTFEVDLFNLQMSPYSRPWFLIRSSTGTAHCPAIQRTVTVTGRIRPHTGTLALILLSIALVLLTGVTLCCGWLTCQLKAQNPIVRKLRERVHASEEDS
jgi:hypothetical protein